MTQARATEHTLKCWRQFYCATVDRFEKLFEVRLNDREFQKGDTIVLQEVFATNKLPGHPVEIGDDLAFTGRQARARISYVLAGFNGLRAGYVVLGLDDLETLPAFEVKAAA